MKNRSMRTAALIWAAIMIAVISSTATMLLIGRTAGSGGVRWVSNEQYAMIERYGRLDEVRSTLMEQYYQPLQEDDLVLGAIRGMTAAVQDDYTFYYTPEELLQENQNTEGRYHGIGVLIGQNAEGSIEVLRVYPDTPAEEAGIQTGDFITGIDGERIGSDGGKAYEEAVAMIRGEENTEVQLDILRGNQVLKLSVRRENVTVSYADYRMLEDGIGYISISQFSGDAADRFTDALQYFAAQNARGMIIDVRNDPGGLLTTVNRIADSILPEGVIVYIQDREGKRTDYYSDENYSDLPLVVLVNDMSASASEILAASVQALNRGKVVGTTTFGKGIVQTLISFDEDGAGMQLTTSSYYDANGRSIQGVGVVPDYEIPLDGERVPLDPDPVSDNQLKEGLRVLEEIIAGIE